MSKLIFDHRSRVADRRSWQAIPEFPLIDCDGLVVNRDRRQRAERRGYYLEEITREDIHIKSILR